MIILGSLESTYWTSY